jgi:plastocyanin
MLKRTITIALAVAALGAGVGACGGSDDEPAAAAAKAPQAGGGTKITMQDNSFAPANAKVAVGETVTFENAGAIAHTATATDGADFDSGTVAPGETFRFKAATAGTVSYLCSFHPGMEGKIEVR